MARLPPNHPKAHLLEKQLYRIGAGHSGECNVDSYLGRIKFSNKTKILTDVHLKLSPTLSFQIDTLIISEHYALIIEVKNISGSVRFIKNPPSLQRTSNHGQDTIIDCPIHQIEANKEYLNQWLRQRGFDVETSGLLVLANPNTIVQDAPTSFPIIYKRQLPFYLQKFQPGKTIFSAADLDKIEQMIEGGRQRFNPFPLCPYYRIDPNELRTGLLCYSCSYELRRLNRETWSCPKCQKRVAKPHNDAITDWFMLVKNSMTNSECRNFLQLKDKNAAHYILSKSELIKKGKSTATFYIKNGKWF